MTPERWEKLKQIFGDALERDPAEREIFVRQAAGDDPELLADVLRLIEESGRDSKLLSRPALASARPFVPDEGPRFTPETILARRFRVVRFIARGGMGEVYEAEDLELGERVALKAIRRHIAPDSELLALFKREVQLARRVTHLNVCRIFDLAQHEDPDSKTTVMLLSMELLDGPTLSEHLRTSGPLSFRDTLPLIEEIAAGLQAIHDAGIIHGDLKPANVMLASRPGEGRPRAVVMDFGMASPVTPRPAGPSVGRGGTPEYFAPEITQGGAVTPASDVYSFALMIVDMLGAPFSDRLRPDPERMPAGGARVLRRCLEAEPARRLAGPAELATALRRSTGTRRRAVAILAAATLLAATGISSALWIGVHDKASRSMASRQILTEDIITVQCPSPDGRFVAAASWDTGDLILRDVSTGSVRRLTHKSTPWARQPAGVYGAVFSPDGRRIAYQWATSRTSMELRVISVDGTGERALYRNPSGFQILPLDWSSDGARILVNVPLEVNGDDRLALISVADGSFQLVSMPQGVHFRKVIFAADGNGLVFTVPKPQNAGSEIHRLSFTGADLTLIASTGNSNSVIGWSPDRKRLIFSSDRRGRTGIWAIAVSDRGVEGDPQELVPDANDWEALGITRTGSLLYRLDADSVDVYTAVLDLAAGRTVSPPQLVMDRFIGSYGYPNWSEDGRRLVFWSHHDPRQPTLLIYEPSSGRKREVPVGLRSMARPQWVDHSTAIMAVGEAMDGVYGLFRISPDMGKATLFRTAQDLESYYEGAWSADGKIHFNRYTDYRRGLFRLNLATGEKRVLYVPPAGVDLGTENLTLSPDRRTLAFHARNDAAGTAALMLLPADGGPARTLLTIRRPEQFLFGSFAWTPDSRRILAVRTTNNRFGEIWQVPVDGSPPTRIEFPAMRVATLRLNADGKTIAFQSGKSRSEIWQLQNFL